MKTLLPCYKDEEREKRLPILPAVALSLMITVKQSPICPRTKTNVQIECTELTDCVTDFCVTAFNCVVSTVTGTMLLHLSDCLVNHSIKIRRQF